MSTGIRLRGARCAFECSNLLSRGAHLAYGRLAIFEEASLNRAFALWCHILCWNYEWWSNPHIVGFVFSEIANRKTAILSNLAPVRQIPASPERAIYFGRLNFP